MKEIVIDGVTYVLTPKEEKKLPTNWKDLGEIEGYCFNANSEIKFYDNLKTNSKNNLHTFATKEQAEASIALAQLTQLYNAYVGDYDYKKSKDGYFQRLINFLAFPTGNMCNHFYEHHKELIEKAKPLL